MRHVIMIYTILVLAMLALTTLVGLEARASTTPVPVLEEVTTTKEIGLDGVEAAAASPDGYLALTDGWVVVVRSPSGELRRVPLLDIAPEAIKWSGNRLLIAGMVSAIVDPFEGEVIAKRSVGLIPLYALFAGNYSIIGDTEGFVVVSYADDRVAVVANVTVEELIAGLGKSGDADMYVVGAAHASGWVAALGFTDITPSWFLVLVRPSTGEARFYDLAKLGVTRVIEYTALAGAVQVGDYIIVYGLSDEVALVRIEEEGLDVLGTYPIRWAPGNITPVIGWGHWLGGDLAVLVGADDIDDSAVDLYRIAFIVRVGDGGVEVIGATTVSGILSPYTTGPGPCFLRTESLRNNEDMIYFYRVAYPPEHPPSPLVYVRASGLTISVNASLSYDPVDSIASMTIDYGDGTVKNYTGLVAEHTYPGRGCYNMTVALTDEAGNSNSVRLVACVKEEATTTAMTTVTTPTITTTTQAETTASPPTPQMTATSNPATATTETGGGVPPGSTLGGEVVGTPITHYVVLVVVIAAVVAGALAVVLIRKSS